MPDIFYSSVPQTWEEQSVGSECPFSLSLDGFTSPSLGPKPLQPDCVTSVLVLKRLTPLTAISFIHIDIYLQQKEVPAATACATRLFLVRMTRLCLFFFFALFHVYEEKKPTQLLYLDFGRKITWHCIFELLVNIRSLKNGLFLLNYFASHGSS